MAFCRGDAIYVLSFHLLYVYEQSLYMMVAGLTGWLMTPTIEGIFLHLGRDLVGRPLAKAASPATHLFSSNNLLRRPLPAVNVVLDDRSRRHLTRKTLVSVYTVEIS